MVNSLQSISIVLLIVYLVLILFLVFRSKASNNAEDYFLAGRKLPFWALSITFIASWWGGGSAIDLVNHGFNKGLSSFWIYGMPVLFATFLMYLFASGIRKVGEITQPQMMEDRYNSTVALLLSVLILIFMVFGVAIQVVVIGNFFHTFFDIDYIWAAILGTLFVLTYSFFGGFRGVVLTDILQFIFLLISSVVLFLMIYKSSGGIDVIRDVAVQHDKPYFFSFFHDWGNNFVYIITFGSSWMIQANIWQRISATKNPKEAKSMMSLAFFVFIPLYLLVAFTGMFSTALYDKVPEGGVVISYIMDYMPVGLAAIIFVGLCSAIMSTMDSLINTGAMVLSIDVFKKYIGKRAKPLQMVWVGKISSLIVTLLGLIVALLIRDMLKVSWIGSDFLATGAFVPIFMAFLWKKGNSLAATCSIIFGMLFSTYNLLVTLGVNLPVYWEIASVRQALTGMILSFLIYVLVSYFTCADTAKAVAFIQKSGIVKGK